MKYSKKGFSLAEVLIAVTIASIIATIGFSIAKKGIERAYNQYIYAGYYAISLALSDAEDGLGLTIRDCVTDENLDNTETCEFSKRIVDVLSGRHINNLRVNGQLNFDTPNGTRYQIRPIIPITSATEANENPTNRYLIRMNVPSVRTRNSSTKSICMIYVENLTVGTNTENFLFPYEMRTDNAACSANAPQPQDDTNIQDRKDLLAFYFEDGKRGRVLIDDAGNERYNPRVFRTAREAMCIKFSNTPPNEISSYLNCNELIINPSLQTWESPSTVIKVTDPRRI